MSLCQDPITLAIFDSERMASYRVGSASIRASSATETFHTISSAISLDPDVGTSVHACTTNLTSPSASDESRRLRMLVNGRNMGLGKDGPLNSVGDVVANVGSPLQAGGSLLIRGDTDVLYKLKMAQIQQQQQQQSKTHNNSMLFPVSNHKVQISIYTIKILKLAVVAV